MVLIISFNQSDPFNPTNIISRALPGESHIGPHISCVTIRLMRRLSDVELIADEYSRVWDAQDDFKQLSANAICRCRMLVGAEGSGLENDFGQVVI